MKLRRIENPPNPYLSEHREWLEEPPEAKIELYEETARSILSRNDSPDLPFTWSVNPYRGCRHACCYCYARPYHEYLGYGAGTDFETKLIIKRNAATLLRTALRKPGWTRETIHFSGITDCYQPIEACYEITRQCLEVCLALANPVAIVTKGFLVVRDAKLLAQLHDRAGARVLMSIPFVEGTTAKLIEPQAPTPARRFEALRRLHQAGVPVGVMLSPIIPGLNDTDIPAILEQAARAGAQWATFVPLRLPGSVEAVFLSHLRRAMPLRVKRIVSRLRAIRGGRLDDAAFGKRMRGAGPYWESIRSLFELSRKRFGLHDSSCRKAGPDCSPLPRNLPTRVPGKSHDPRQLVLDF